jgi:hypothetical protein
MMLQLDPPLPMTTPKGGGLAHFVIDYGPETHLMWVVFLDADGSCWTVPNPEIRMASNWSMGRRLPRPGVLNAPLLNGGRAADDAATAAANGVPIVPAAPG